MSSNKNVLRFMVLVLFAIGTTHCGDDGSPPITMVEATPDSGLDLAWRPLPDKPYCYQIKSIGDALDGCALGVADQVGRFVEGVYDDASSTFALGTEGAWGLGQIVGDDGVLIYEIDLSHPTIPGCTWHQMVNTTIKKTATGTFTASIVEQHTNVASACGVTTASCTSSWTWHLSANGEKSPDNHCQ